MYMFIDHDFDTCVIDHDYDICVIDRFKSILGRSRVVNIIFSQDHIYTVQLDWSRRPFITSFDLIKTSDYPTYKKIYNFLFMY